MIKPSWYRWIFKISWYLVLWKTQSEPETSDIKCLVLTSDCFIFSNQFAIHYLVDNEIDLSGFESRFRNDEEGRPGYDPRILLKVILTGYSRGIVHSRKLERACRENVIFMAMACGQTPDHSTLAHFVSSMQDLILTVFRDILLVCEKEGLLGAGCPKCVTNIKKTPCGTSSRKKHPDKFPMNRDKLGQAGTSSRSCQRLEQVSS